MSNPAPAATAAASDTLRRADSIGEPEPMSVRSQTNNMLVFPPPQPVKARLRPSEEDMAVSRELNDILQRLVLERPDKMPFMRDLALTFLRPLPLILLLLKSTCALD